MFLSFILLRFEIHTLISILIDLDNLFEVGTFVNSSRGCLLELFSHSFVAVSCPH